MGYFAIIKLEDCDGNDVWKMKGHAQEVLAKAIRYIDKKDGSKRNLRDFLKEDFEQFETFLGKFFEEERHGRRK